MVNGKGKAMKKKGNFSHYISGCPLESFQQEPPSHSHLLRDKLAASQLVWIILA